MAGKIAKGIRFKLHQVSIIEYMMKGHNRPLLKVERSTWEIGAASDTASVGIGGTENEVDLIVIIQGSTPVYRTVERAFPA